MFVNHEYGALPVCSILKTSYTFNAEIESLLSYCVYMPSASCLLSTENTMFQFNSIEIILFMFLFLFSFAAQQSHSICKGVEENIEINSHSV